VAAALNDLVQALDNASSAGELILAVRRLAASQDPAAISPLIRVLSYNNPGAAVAAVDGLVAQQAAAVDPLLSELDGHNYSARAWAIRALALIADPRALNILLEAAGDFALSVRRAAVKGLGSLHWQALPPTEAAAGQRQALSTLLSALADPEWVVRYATVVGLETLAPALAEAELEALKVGLRQTQTTDETLAVRVRSQLALSRLVNQPCAPEPAATP
jgi:phycocyanobilin lyase beta subunit